MHCHASGASMDSIHLLSKYLEITSDVQSCTLIAIRTFPPKLLQENQVQVWITRYCSQVSHKYFIEIWFISTRLYHSHLILFYSQFSTLQSSIFYKTEAYMRWGSELNSKSAIYKSIKSSSHTKLRIINIRWSGLILHVIVTVIDSF